LAELDIIRQILAALAGSVSLEQCLSRTLSVLRQTGQLASGAILLPDRESKEFHALAAEGSSIQAVSLTIKSGEGICGKAALSGNPVILPQAKREEFATFELALWGERKTATFAVFPLMDNTSILGLLCVLIPVSSKRDLARWKRLFLTVSLLLVQPVKWQYMLEQERARFDSETVSLKTKLLEEFSFHNLIGNSHEMRDIYEQVARVAQTATTVLLRGESGTGKELIAEAIHYNSLRKDKPFIRVNCSAIPETLIESEFFGYEKGAFTGAASRKKGRFELAHTGTIFLDEIGDLSPFTQVKLLRVLQNHSFERVGGGETIQVDVRVIAATNTDLETLMDEGKFREDLYYRLNVFSIFLPPLRDRRTDILLLADHFMLKYARKHSKAVRRISTPAIDILMSYHWPGNVRELENCIERAVLVCDDQVIHSYHLPPTLQTAESSGTLPHRSLTDAVEELEKELIQDALKSSRGNRARAARLLGITERMIGYKVDKYGIDSGRFRS